MSPNPTPTQADSVGSTDNTGLSIGELARRTGTTPEALRMWEVRYQFPRPRRLPSGHRRYRESEVPLVAQVLRRRGAGIRLDVAIAEALELEAPGTGSVFAELRRSHPQLTPHRLRKATLIALSWALEDEFCARATRPVLFGAFQQERFYRPSAARWTELTRSSRSAIVFADFEATSEGVESGPQLATLAADAPLRREWVVVCDAPELAACLSAWELPGQGTVPDRDRIFEAMWTIDPRAVRAAARCCARAAQAAGVGEAGPLLYDLAAEPPPTVVDVLGATQLLNRVVAYVDRGVLPVG